MNTYGLQPAKHWRLFEHEGFQVLAYVEEDEDTGKIGCALEGFIVELGATSKLFIGTDDEASAKLIFEKLSEEGNDERVIQAFLDEAGPAFQALMSKVDLADTGFEVATVGHGAGAVVGGDDALLRGPHAPVQAGSMPVDDSEPRD